MSDKAKGVCVCAHAHTWACGCARVRVRGRVHVHVCACESYEVTDKCSIFSKVTKLQEYTNTRTIRPTVRKVVYTFIMITLTYHCIYCTCLHDES